jgi:thioredoxin 1
MALTLTDNNFKDTVLNSDKVSIVDFWAVWCGPCRMIAPSIEELAKEYDGKAVIGKLNVDENPQVSMEYGIRSIPTILFFKNGKIVDKQVGVVPKSVLESKLKAQMQQPV